MKDIGTKKVNNFGVVLHILEPEPEGTIGGADMHVLELAKCQMTYSDFDPIIFINQNRQFINLLKANNISYIFFDKKNGFFSNIRDLIHWLSNNKIKIIHSHGYDANYITFILKVFHKEIKGIPIVMTCHGWIKNNLRNIIKTYIDFFTLKIANSLIYVSKDIMPKIPNKNKHYAYIPNGVYSRNAEVNLDIRKLFKIKKKYKIIAYVGRFSPEKRIDVFLKSCFEILKIYNEVKFIIVGSGSEEPKLRMQLQELGIESNIIFTGLILDFNLLSNIYSQIDFLVQTSDTETTSRVVLEAMSAMKPIVATKVGDMQELIHHKKNGFLVEKGDYVSIANYCIKLLSDKSLRLKYGRKSYELYQAKFTMEKEIKSIDNIYIASVLNYEVHT